MVSMPIQTEAKKLDTGYSGELQNIFLKNTNSVPSISAEYSILYEPQSGYILYGKNFSKEVSFASIVKLLSALVFLDSSREEGLSSYYTLPPVDTGDSQIGLLGREFTGIDLLNASMVISGNDAILALAESVDGFKEKANLKAEELNLRYTAIENPIGYDGENQKSNAFDLSILGYEATKNKTLSGFFDDLTIEIEARNGDTFFGHNTNKLLERNLGVDGIKTGTTADAGQSVLFSYRIDGIKIYGVVLKSSNRFSDAEDLIKWSRESFGVIEMDRA